MKPEDQERHDRFMQSFETAMRVLGETVAQRQLEYNTVTPIQELLQSADAALGMAELKMKRARDQITRWNLAPSAKARASVEDSLIDGMAYLGFAWAWLQEPRPGADDE